MILKEASNGKKASLLALTPASVHFFNLSSVFLFSVLFRCCFCRVDPSRRQNQAKSHPSDHLLKVVYSTFSTVMALQSDQNKSRLLKLLGLKVGVEAKQKNKTQ